MSGRRGAYALRPHQVEANAWRHDALRLLLNAIANAADEGRIPPCMRGGAEWTSDDPDDQHEAALACRFCPVLADCRDYINEFPESAGVWAGQTNHPKGTT